MGVHDYFIDFFKSSSGTVQTALESLSATPTDFPYLY
jgi:hypothetical protein